MPQVIEITDFAAPELDVYARLSEVQLLNRQTPSEGLFVAESPMVIERALNAGSGGENAVVRVGVDAVPESLEVRVNGMDARFIGPMQPENGRGYVEGVVWNDYARRIVDTLPEAAAYVAEFALPNVAAGAARVELRGLGGEVTWLEIAVGAR